MSRPAVIVVGTGRSGTSFAAQVCHEDLGICMGHYLKEGNSNNPEGFFEDLHSHGLLMLALNGTITPAVYWQNVCKSHVSCDLWGLKDPKFLYLPINTIASIAPKLIIRTWRPLKATVDSFIKANVVTGLDGKALEEAKSSYQKMILERETLMDVKLRYFNTLTIRMDKKVEKSDLITAIKSTLCLNN